MPPTLFSVHGGVRPFLWALNATGRRLRHELPSRAAACLLALLFVLAPEASWAGGAGGGALPWEAPLTLIATSLTGPVAFSLSLICLAVAGGTIAFGGELPDFARRLVLLVLALAILVAGAGLLTTLFGVGGAVVANAVPAGPSPLDALASLRDVAMLRAA